MSYCVVADVQALNPKRTYNSSSTPTNTQVNTLIKNIAAEIDMALVNTGYSVPITEPTTAVNYLKLLNALGAAGLAEGGMFPEKTEPGQTSHGQQLYKEYKTKLEYLKTNGLETVSKSSNQPSSYSIENSTDDHLGPLVDKDTKF